MRRRQRSDLGVLFFIIALGWVYLGLPASRPMIEMGLFLLVTAAIGVIFVYTVWTRPRLSQSYRRITIALAVFGWVALACMALWTRAKWPLGVFTYSEMIMVAVDDIWRRYFLQ